MTKEVVIGLDLGTTSVKAVLFDMKGNLVYEAEEMIQTSYPKPGHTEQDPEEIEQASRKAVRQAAEQVDSRQDKLLAIGISCAMHSLICVDEACQPLSQMLLWSDRRSSGQAERLKKEGGQDIYLRTGTPIHPMSPLVKLLWMKENSFGPYKKASYFMSMKEYLLQKWFRQRVIDYSMASATGMFQLKTHSWDDEAVKLAGINKEQLSEIVSPTHVLTGMDQGAAEEMGLSPDVPVVIGAADGQLANLGSGAVSKGEAVITAGTSGAIRQVIKGTAVNENQETFTYAFTEESSIIGGPTNNGGIALQWVKDLLGFRGTHEELLEGAEQIAPGADGLLFHPYVNGERAPLWNPRAKGNFYGLSIEHTKEHFVRAVLEGITFNIYQIGRALETAAGKPVKISVNGGLAKSPLWVQMTADMFGQEVYLSDTHHNAAWGAAWTALMGIGKVSSLEAIKENLPSEKEVKPNMETHAAYQEVYRKYRKIGDFLAESFE